MTKKAEILSGCCKAETEPKEISKSWFHSICSKCQKEQKWALIWRSGRRHGQAPGVYQDYEGNKWFADCLHSDANGVRECLERGQKLVCSVAEVVSTMGLVYNTQDTDCLPHHQHVEFARQWAKKVKNPEVVKELLER